LGGWVFNFLPELGKASEIVEASTEAAGEVAAASVVEVAVDGENPST
jgi:hypothetical protein